MADSPRPFGNGPVPAVDPADLKAVFTMFRADTRETDGSSALGYNVRLLAERCRNGSDVLAVWFRGTVLQSLAHQGLLAPWQAGLSLEQCVFDAGAGFPLDSAQSFDADEFLSFLNR